MKISFNRENFWKVFQIAAAVAPPRSPKTILQNVFLNASKDICELMATDMEVGVRLKLEGVNVDTAGQVVVPVSRLSMILRESSDEELTLETDGDQTVITGMHSRFELATQNPDEFPQVNTFDEESYFEITAGVLKELIKRTLFATDADSSRYALGGLLLETDGETLTAVGTDGRRLAKMEGPVKKVGDSSMNSSETIVPARSMQLIERILVNDETVIRIATRANDLMLAFPGGVIYSRLLEGRFPKWREVLPSRTESTKIDLQVGPMYSALRQAAIVASEESRGIDFTFNNGTLVLSNRTAEVGKSRIEMPISYEEDELIVTLDHRYVADFLKVLQPDRSFTFDVDGSDSAAYCQTDDSYGYVIMPLSKDRE